VSAPVLRQKPRNYELKYSTEAERNAAKKRAAEPHIARFKAEAEARFRERACDAGFTLLPFVEWQGNKQRYAAVCPEGHECFPKPNAVLDGVQGCRACSVSNWTAFYVCVNRERHWCKFGVSAQPERRLRVHARQGFTEVVMLRENLADPLALENAVRFALELAGEEPVQGREYFDVSTLATILDVAEGVIARGSEPA
jgi:hypothetical protein